MEITCDGRTVEGTVTLASSNGRSLVLAFEALLGGHAGMMPVLGETAEGPFHALLTGQAVELRSRYG